MWNSSQRVGADEVYESKWIRTISIKCNSENNVLRIVIWYSDKQKNPLNESGLHGFQIIFLSSVFIGNDLKNCVTISYILMRIYTLLKG